MARPRTPTNVLDARGSFRKHPERKRVDPDTSGPLSAAPDHLSAQALECWNDIAASAPTGVLTDSDRIALELAANLLAQFRADPLEFKAMRLVRLEVLLGKFGMTPSDRSKVSIATGPKPSANPFAEL
ncbi:terminase [Stutzerimonas stutzeri]|nr:terminase [Stutzerimonas stutzeri]RTM23609.1 terminase [Stutzerimonas stutzeri]